MEESSDKPKDRTKHGEIPAVLEPFYFKPKLPKPKTPFESLLQGLRLMPEDVLSSDQVVWDRALERLDSRYRFVLERRHGLHGLPRLTLEAIGKEIGRTRERIRQLEEEAHRFLRKYATDLHLISEDAPNRLSLSCESPYWPPGTKRGAPLGGWQV